MAQFDVSGIGGGDKSVKATSNKQPQEVKGAVKKGSLWIKENKNAKGFTESTCYYEDRNKDGKITSDELVQKDVKATFYKDGKGNIWTSEDPVRPVSLRHVGSGIVRIKYDENGEEISKEKIQYNVII